MIPWTKFRRASRAERRLLLEALVLVAAIALVLPWCSFGWLRRRLRWYAGRPAGRLDAERITWAVNAASRRLPGRWGRCLPRALAAEALLSRHGYRPRLRIGVRQVSSGAGPGTGRVEAHAWVELDGRVLVGELDDLASFSPLGEPVEAARWME